MRPITNQKSGALWTNYHSHTSYCDGKSTIQDVVLASSRQGLVAVGLSSHAPLPFARRWCMKQENLHAYLEEIDLTKRSGPLEVYAGLEADFIPGKISPADFRPLLDYVIGSIHFVDELFDGDGWEIDGPYESFLKGLNDIFKGNTKAAVCRYFELTRQMIVDGTPDVVGHIDKIKMQSKEGTRFSEDESWYVNQIKETLDVIHKAGCIIEINTRGWYQRKTTTTYPSPWIIEQIAELGIPVTLSSDAHHPDDLTNHFPAAARLLLQAGIKKIRILTAGKWRDVGFNEHGIEDNKMAH